MPRRCPSGATRVGRPGGWWRASAEYAGARRPSPADSVRLRGAGRQRISSVGPPARRAPAEGARRPGGGSSASALARTPFGGTARTDAAFSTVSICARTPGAVRRRRCVCTSCLPLRRLPAAADGILAGPADGRAGAGPAEGTWTVDPLPARSPGPRPEADRGTRPVAPVAPPEPPDAIRRRARTSGRPGVERSPGRETRQVDDRAQNGGSRPGSVDPNDDQLWEGIAPVTAAPLPYW